MTRDDIWFATADRISQWFKWSLCDDTGPLSAEPGVLRFQGKKCERVMTKIVSLSVVRQTTPWLSILFGLGLVVACISFGVMSFFTWENPATIPLLIGLAAFNFAVIGPVAWVEVEYRNEQGQAEKAYFMNGRAILTRLFGASDTLRREIQQALAVSTTSANGPNAT